MACFSHSASIELLGGGIFSFHSFKDSNVFEALLTVAFVHWTFFRIRKGYLGALRALSFSVAPRLCALLSGVVLQAISLGDSGKEGDKCRPHSHCISDVSSSIPISDSQRPGLYSKRGLPHERFHASKHHSTEGFSITLSE